VGTGYRQSAKSIDGFKGGEEESRKIAVKKGGDPWRNSKVLPQRQRVTEGRETITQKEATAQAYKNSGIDISRNHD